MHVLLDINSLSETNGKFVRAPNRYSTKIGPVVSPAAISSAEIRAPHKAAI